MNSELTADSESNSLDASDDSDDKTFISKLLVEMKSQFNNTEIKKKGLDLANSYDTTDTSHRSMEGGVDVEQNTNGSFIEIQDMNVKNEEENESNESSTEQVIGSLKENDITEEVDDGKPRIVLTFRKPSVSNKARVKDEKLEEFVNRKSLRNRNTSDDKSDETVLKRSARRRSKDCNESVLQSAIARKEKSYNEGNKPQRLSRQLKPTQKILDNIAHAASKFEKCKSERSKSRYTDKQKLIDSDNVFDDTVNSETDDKEGELYKNHRRSPKKLKVSHTDSDADLLVTGIKKSDSNSSLSDNSRTSSKVGATTTEEKPSRRSQRLSTSRMKDRSTDMELSESAADAFIAETESAFKVDLDDSSDTAQLMESKLCLCTQKTHFYVDTAEDDVMHCAAVDNLNDKLVGCSNIVDAEDISLLRPSRRVPYIVLCKVHYNRMLRHNCCPTCGIFCTQGRFVECDEKHHFHRDCQVSIGNKECCPHCGSDTPKYDVYISICPSKKPIILPTQRISYPAAKMSFPDSSDNSEKKERSVSPPIVPEDAVDIPMQCDTVNSISSISEVLAVIKDENFEKLAVILAAGFTSLLETPAEEYGGGTVLHYACQHGILPAVHMLNVAGVELDSLDNEQNTPLLTAIITHNNDVVKYLIKAGASITLKGMDGMTALHLAAKVGNLNACELLLVAASGIKGYINMGDEGGWTPLIWACEQGQLAVAKYLIKEGANPYARDVEQNVALHWAAFSNSAHIIEVLLNNGCDVNAVNAHGETPLHTAARQDNYNSVIMLLARGADVMVVNKLGESCIDCVPQKGSSYSAIALNVHILAVRGSPSRKRILNNDISRGKENYAVQCINLVDDEPEPTDYVYISKNCLTSDICIDQKITNLQSCSCSNRCNTDSCVCCRNSLRCWYDEDGKLLDNFNYSDPAMIFECNEVCACNSATCGNRIIQRGSMQRFQLFRTEAKGWGLRTLRHIPKGTFVCEYVGEILSDAEAEQRDDDSFLFDLDNRQCIRTDDSDLFCIDARQYGNCARFINHSCEPNLLPVRVFIDHQDLRFPRIALFANRDILQNEELSFDYGEKFWLVKYKSITCNCGSSICKYSVEAISATLERYNQRLQEDV